MDDDAGNKPAESDRAEPDPKAGIAIVACLRHIGRGRRELHRLSFVLQIRMDGERLYRDGMELAV